MAKKSQVRGLGNERKSSRANIETGSEKFSKAFTHKKAAMIPLAALTTAMLPSMQAHADFIYTLAAPLIMYKASSKISVPFEIPYHRGKWNKGFFFFGNELDTNKEIWMSDSESRRHILTFGTTGSGKTESLVGLIANSLSQNSAFTYIDGKADTGLFSKIFSMCRRYGREDDLLVVNYMVGTLRADLKREKKLSNTLNPTYDATSEALYELITSLLPSGGSSDGIWKDRAASYMSALIRPLVELRDQGKLLLDVNVIRSYFQLEKTIELSKRTDLDPKATEGLKAYVLNLPGYKEGAALESTCYEQHGYVSMQFQPCFGMLSDSYGHIMKAQLAEVNFNDVVIQRRCLLVLLPALEKSPSNLANLGKIIISSIKGMMAGALGAELEGHTGYILDSRPTNGRTYQCVFDEFGYYAVEGSAVMPAQARGIGFALLFSGQDYQAFTKSSPEEAASIKANCATKVGMCIEDATDTAAIWIDGAGEGSVEVNAGYEREKGMFGSYFAKSKQVNIEKKNKVDLLDLKGQGPGEFHLLNKDTLIRGRSFYADPPKPKWLRVNSFIKVKPPSAAEIEMVQKSLQLLRGRFEELRKLKKEKLYSTWNYYSDTETKEFSNNMAYLVDSEPLMQAAFAFAARKNAIDIVNSEMVLKVKEMEDVINKGITPDQEFSTNDVYDVIDVSELDKMERKSIGLEPLIEQIEEKIKFNEDYITENVNLDANPFSNIDIEIDEAHDLISDLSKSIIERWDENCVLDKDNLIFNQSIQDNLAYLCSQKIVISAEESVIEATEVIDDIDIPDIEFKDD